MQRSRFISAVLISSVLSQGLMATSADAIGMDDIWSVINKVRGQKPLSLADNQEEWVKPNPFYEQNITTTAYFKNMDRPAQDKLLNTMFDSRKNSVANSKITWGLGILGSVAGVIGYGIYKLRQNHIQDLINPGSVSLEDVLTTAGGRVLRDYITQPFCNALNTSSPLEALEESGKAAVGILGMGAVIYGGMYVLKSGFTNLFTGTIERFGRGLNKFENKIYGLESNSLLAKNFVLPSLKSFSTKLARLFGTDQNKFEQIERKYFLTKRFTLPSLQFFIEYRLAELAAEAKKPTEGVNSHAINWILDGITVALGLHKDADKVTVYDPNLFQQKFAGYKKNLRDVYRAFYVKQTLSQNTEDEVTTLLVKGVPEAGKTVSVKTLAEVMNASVIKISGADSAEKLLGSSQDPGLLARLMAEQGDGRAKILFIDEFDRTNPDYPMLAKLLNPKLKSYYNPYYDCELPLPKIRIATGSELAWDPAALKQAHVVEYTGFEKSYKRQVLLDKLRANLKKLSENGRRTLKFEELSQDQLRVVDTIVERDEDIGFNSSGKVIEIVALHLIDKKYNPYTEVPNFLEILRQQNAHLKAGYRTTKK